MSPEYLNISPYTVCLLSKHSRFVVRIHITTFVFVSVIVWKIAVLSLKYTFKSIVICCSQYHRFNSRPGTHICMVSSLCWVWIFVYLGNWSLDMILRVALIYFVLHSNCQNIGREYKHDHNLIFKNNSIYKKSIPDFLHHTLPYSSMITII